MSASLETFLIASLTKTDWSKTTAVFSDSGMSTRCLIAAFIPLTMVIVLLSPPCLKTGT